MKNFKLPKDASIELIVFVLNNTKIQLHDESLEPELKKLGVIFDS